MKRIFLLAGAAFVLASCAQHDPNTPSTSGNDPQSPNRQSPAADSSDAANGMQNGTTNGSTGTAPTPRYDSLPSSNNQNQKRQ